MKVTGEDHGDRRFPRWILAVLAVGAVVLLLLLTQCGGGSPDLEEQPVATLQPEVQPSTFTLGLSQMTVPGLLHYYEPGEILRVFGTEVPCTTGEGEFEYHCYPHRHLFQGGGRRDHWVSRSHESGRGEGMGR